VRGRRASDNRGSGRNDSADRHLNPRGHIFANSVTDFDAYSNCDTHANAGSHVNAHADADAHTRANSNAGLQPISGRDDPSQ
tara:strand:- start:1333 stop:1578 length:246 start_codon:yes stop_codon:yes gene_type:complete